jgi:hypothetical protein
VSRQDSCLQKKALRPHLLVLLLLSLTLCFLLLPVLGRQQVTASLMS